MVRTFKILKMLFQHILCDNTIYIVTAYYGKKWSKDFQHIKKVKVKQSKREKQKYSFHYYFH